MGNRFGRATKTGHILLWSAVGVCLAAIMRSQPPDRTCAIVTGIAYGAAVLYTRYFLQIRFLEVPGLWLLALGVFHLGLVVPWAIGLYDAWNTWWLGRADLPSALFLFVLALVSYQIGLIIATTKPAAVRATAERQVVRELDNRTLFLAGVLLMAVSGAMYLVGFWQTFGSGVSSLVYADMYQVVMETDSRVLGVGLLVFPMALYVAAAGATRKQLFAVFGIAGLWAIWQLFLGYRSRGFLIVIIALYIASKKRFSIPRRVLIAIVVAAAYVIPLVSIVRVEATGERFSKGLLQDVNPLNGFAEMGQAIWPLAETYRLVGPNQFRHGRTYLSAFNRAVPNIGRGFTPGKRLQEINIEDSPAYWFVLATEPYLFHLNLGRGFSAVAEAYMNFGVWGVVAIFSVLGYGLVRLERFSTRSVFSLAAVAVVLDPALWAVRNDFSVFTRSAVWGCSFVFLVWWLASKFVGESKRAVGSPKGEVLKERVLCRAAGERPVRGELAGR